MNIFDCGGLTKLEGSRVTYCLDISGSMYTCLDTVKTQLVEHLKQKLDAVNTSSSSTALFNLIAFSTEVYPWSNEATLFNSNAVKSATEWIEQLECKTGTNTLDALVKALEDEQTSAVCLLTDDLCDQQPYVVLNRVSQIARGRPIHCIYISSSRSDASEQAAIEFLRHLASITRGTFQIVTIARRGQVEKITPIITHDSASTMQLANLTLHASSSTPILTTLHHTTATSTAAHFPAHPFVVSAAATGPGASASCSMPLMAATATTSSVPYSVQTNYPVQLVSTSSGSSSYSDLMRVQQQMGGHPQCKCCPSEKNTIAFSAEAGLMLVGRRVLARSKLDGYYYRGKVISQVLAHRFTVEFEPKPSNTTNKDKDKSSYKSSGYQDTAIYDLIHFDDAIQHPIRVGDKCLAALDTSSGRYAPAEVLEGFHKRASQQPSDKLTSNVTLIVRFSSGKTRTLDDNDTEAIWLPDQAYDRLKFELNLPSTARNYLEACHDDYPQRSLPGYPCEPMQVAKATSATVMPRFIYATWPFYVPYYPACSYPVASSSSSSFSSLSTSLNVKPPVYQHRDYGIVNEPKVNSTSVTSDAGTGANFKVDELSRKIEEQIHKHRHLLNEIEEKRTKSRSCSHERAKSSEEKTSTSCCCRHHKISSSGNESNGNDLRNSHHVCQADAREALKDNQYNNKYYEDYRLHMHDLYHQVQQHDTSSHHHCGHSHNSRSSSPYLCKSKSVSFCDLLSDAANDSDHSLSCCSSSSSKHSTSSHGKKSKKSKKPANYSNVPSRFGNPKVSVGLPERTPRRSTSSLETSKSTSIAELGVTSGAGGAKKVIRQFDRWEKAHKERMSEEMRRSQARDDYKRTQLRNREAEWEKANTTKPKYQYHLRPASSISYGKSTESLSLEAKQEKKLAFLRNQAAKRDVNNFALQQDQVLKEANKLAFKRDQETRRNEKYHDRVVAEEAWRLGEQRRAQEKFEQMKRGREAKENQEKQRAELEKSLRQEKMVKMRNNIFY